MYGEIFKGKGDQYYWRLLAGNGRVIAIGGESYSKLGNAQRAWQRFVSELKLTVEIRYPRFKSNISMVDRVNVKVE